LLLIIVEGRRKKEKATGNRQQATGNREEGRRKREEGRRKRERESGIIPNSQFPTVPGQLSGVLSCEL
jgi:hypothetical protein